MPTYVYRCSECGHEFEVFGKMSDRPRARKCPVCGERATRQISGGAGFLFKGEGFYITDYRSQEYRAKEKAEKGEPAKASEKEKPAAAEKGGSKETADSGGGKEERTSAPVKSSRKKGK